MWVLVCKSAYLRNYEGFFLSISAFTTSWHKTCLILRTYVQVIIIVFVCIRNSVFATYILLYSTFYLFRVVSCSVVVSIFNYPIRIKKRILTDKLLLPFSITCT